MTIPGLANLTEHRVRLEKQYERIAWTQTTLLSKNPASPVKNPGLVEDLREVLLPFRARRSQYYPVSNLMTFNISQCQ